MLTIDHSAATWYEATAARGPRRPEIAGDVEAEVCVIGGGLAGLTIVLELARRGRPVILVEAERLVAAASGRNGGFVYNGFAESIANVAVRVGRDAARALYLLSRHGTEYVRREIAAHDPSIRMGEGWLCAERRDTGEMLKRRRDSLMRDYDDERIFLDTAETRQRLASTRYHQSLLDPRAFHMHPLRYGLMLAGLAEAAGARIFEASPVLAVGGRDGQWRVRCRQGTVKAAQVVHAVSSLDRRLHRLTGQALLPVATYVAVTNFLPGQEAIHTPAAVSDSRRAGNYYRLIDDNRILWGGAITTRISEPRRLAERMRADMVSVFPQLSAARIDFAWASLMAYALHKMPLIGRDGEGQWYATGFGGHGMNTTAMAGLLIARAIAAGDDEYRRFQPFAPVWAGGPFGRLGVQGSYWWMQLRDKIDEANWRRTS